MTQKPAPKWLTDRLENLVLPVLFLAVSCVIALISGSVSRVIFTAIEILKNPADAFIIGVGICGAFNLIYFLDFFYLDHQEKDPVSHIPIVRVLLGNVLFGLPAFCFGFKLSDGDIQAAIGSVLGVALGIWLGVFFSQLIGWAPHAFIFRNPPRA